MIELSFAVRFQVLPDVVDLSYVLTLSGFGRLRHGADRRRTSVRGRPVGPTGTARQPRRWSGRLTAGLARRSRSNLMNVRWIPLDPPWLLVPFLAGTVLAAFVIANDGPYLVMLAIAGVAIACGALGVDRWYEQRHPGGRLR
jgi:hypothetical protein